jgi:hypothetical protein
LFRPRRGGFLMVNCNAKAVMKLFCVMDGNTEKVYLGCNELLSIVRMRIGAGTCAEVM